MLQRKDPLPISVADFRGMENRYGNRESKLSATSDDIAFDATGGKERKGSKKKSDKMLQV